MSGRWRAATTAALAAMALGAAPGAPAAPDPAGGSPAQLLTELQRLHRELGEATETYQATARTLAERRARNKRLGTGLAKARVALAEGRDAAGQLARRQYQGVVEVSPTLRLLLAADAQGALDQEHVLRRAARDRVATVERLTAAERRASGLARQARAALDEEQVLAARQRTQHQAAREKLDEVTALVSSLSPDQLAEVDGLEAERGEEAGRNLVAAGGLSSASAVPTRRGERAVRFAVDQIGKPYVWGAEGPDSYDCSGLTQRAWASAGTGVPRTSQEQWAELDRVPLRQLRPGDLVVYFPEATHVALYLGDGLVVHAPRPGAAVKVSPVAANPVLGAVRPDPDGPPVPEYEPPALPEGAREGSDTGYARRRRRRGEALQDGPMDLPALLASASLLVPEEAATENALTVRDIWDLLQYGFERSAAWCRWRSADDARGQHGGGHGGRTGGAAPGSASAPRRPTGERTVHEGVPVGVPGDVGLVAVGLLDEEPVGVGRGAVATAQHGDGGEQGRAEHEHEEDDDTDHVNPRHTPRPAGAGRVRAPASQRRPGA